MSNSMMDDMWAALAAALVARSDVLPGIREGLARLTDDDKAKIVDAVIEGISPGAPRNGGGGSYPGACVGQTGVGVCIGGGTGVQGSPGGRGVLQGSPGSVLAAGGGVGDPTKHPDVILITYSVNPRRQG